MEPEPLPASPPLASIDEFHDNAAFWFAKHFDLIKLLVVGETHRGAAVLVRAYMELLLSQILRVHADLDPLNRNRLLQAADSFNIERKIELARELKLWQMSSFPRMKLLLKIGNAFAHNPDCRNADDPRVRHYFTKLRHITFGKDTPAEPLAILGEALREVVATLAGFLEPDPTTNRHVMDYETGNHIGFLP